MSVRRSAFGRVYFGQALAESCDTLPLRANSASLDCGAFDQFFDETVAELAAELRQEMLGIGAFLIDCHTQA